MAITKARKEEFVAKLTERVSSSDGVIVFGYKGMSYAQLSTVRIDMKAAGHDFRVMKNTLIQIAVKAGGFDLDESVMVNPTGILVVSGDFTEAAKKMKDFSKQFEHFELKGGYFDGTVLSAADIATIAELPSREELIASVLRCMNGPATGLVSVLTNVPRGLLNALVAIKDK